MRQNKLERNLVFNVMRKAERLATQRGFIASVTDNGSSMLLHVWNRGSLVLSSELQKDGSCFSRMHDGDTITRTLTGGPDSAVDLLGWAYTA